MEYLFSLLILFNAYIFRKYIGSYMHPSIIFSILWFVYTIIPLAICYDVPINPLGILYIYGCTVAFSLPSLFYNWKKLFIINDKKLINKKLFNSKLMNVSLLVSSILSIVLSTFSLMSNGYDLSAIIFDLLKTSGEFAARRGFGHVEADALASSAVLFTFLSAVLGGLIYLNKNSMNKRILTLLISLGPSVFFMVIQSSKLMCFYSISFYAASNIVYKIFNRNYVILEKSTFIKILFMPIVLVPFIAISILSRDGYTDYYNIERSSELVLVTLQNYALAQIFAFSDFFSYTIGMDSQINYIDQTYSYGLYTFTFIFSLLGYEGMVSSVLYDSYAYKDLISTNIFTVYRGLIYDFGILGSLLFFVIFGIIVNYIYYRLLNYNKQWFACSSLIICLVFLQGTYNISMFMARYMFLLGFVVYLLLKINGRFNFSKNRFSVM